jgi:hypothetical protein
VNEEGEGGGQLFVVVVVIMNVVKKIEFVFVDRELMMMLVIM